MSYPTDVLMYVSVADRKTMETFNERLSQITRFNAHPWMVDTNDWSGPNVFGGDVWAFGADYLLPDDFGDVLRSVRWRHPQNVVALLTQTDAAGAAPTEVFRPIYTVGPMSFYGEQSVEQTVVELSAVRENDQ